LTPRNESSTSEAGPGTRPAASSGRRGILILAAVLGAIVLAAVAATALGGPGRRVETGIVVAVEATGLSAVQGFSIRTADGRTVDFRVGSIENATAFPPGHLAAHKASLAPVRVTYVEQSGTRLAVRLDDAP
jgi:hypothetical protein